MTVWSTVKEFEFWGCPKPHTEGWTEVHGVVATWIKCQEGYAAGDSGHIVLQWSKSGRTYGIGFHGQNWFNYRLAMTVAQTLRIVRPRRSGN